MSFKIISEIGINHNGDFRLIEELVRQSALGGADFAKFQLYDSVRVFGDDSRARNEFSYEQVETILSICNAYDIEFFASVFDEEKLEWCMDLNVGFFKIASRTVVKEQDLCRDIIKTGLPTFTSLGFWDKDNLPFDNPNVLYFNCVSKYPTSILDQKQASHRSYEYPVVGVSDHSYGIANCLHHISRGALYVEKHFTLDKSMPGNDHIGSMDIEELTQLRDIGNQLHWAYRNSGEFV
ncbi:hypothetical protein CMK19_01270 [Candidatus Poribacteria bacterium]|nr:hypothetical protein [Candidatus Poribacteria bacterium]